MKSLFITFSLAILSITVLSSCYKKQDTIAIIKVVDQDANIVSNARVIIYGSGTQGTINLRDTVFTNSNGEAHFNFDEVYQSGQAGVAIVDIEVMKNGVTSYALLKVEQEATTRKHVVLGQ